MSSQGGTEPPSDRPFDAVVAPVFGAASAALDSLRDAAGRRGTGTCTGGFGEAGFRAVCGARPGRSDETRIPALRNTSSAALAPLGARGDAIAGWSVSGSDDVAGTAPDAATTSFAGVAESSE